MSSGVPGDNETCFLRHTEHEKCYCNTGYSPTCSGCEGLDGVVVIIAVVVLYKYLLLLLLECFLPVLLSCLFHI